MLREDLHNKCLDVMAGIQVEVVIVNENIRSIIQCFVTFTN